eukprot:101304_1
MANFVEIILFLIPLIQCAICTNAPIIGILTIPCVSEPWYCPSNVTDNNATSFMYSSYVKWIEGGGGRVVPIQADQSAQKVRNLLSQLNGVLFTGGAASFDISTSIYFQQVVNIMDYLLQYSNKNKGGKSIPLWATCLGFEAITVYIANNHSIVGNGYNSQDVSLPINFTSNAEKQSQMFNSFMDKGYTNSVYTKLSTENLTINMHNQGFNPSVWQSNKYLKGNMSLLGISMDLNGRWFGTLQESKNSSTYNSFQSVYASQFHPEKPQYVFDEHNGSNHISHSLDAIYVNQYFVEFFVNECRLRNDNVMDKQTYQDSVIYNYAPYWYDDGATQPEQLYWFKKPQ